MGSKSEWVSFFPSFCADPVDVFSSFDATPGPPLSSRQLAKKTSGFSHQVSFCATGLLYGEVGVGSLTLLPSLLFFPLSGGRLSTVIAHWVIRICINTSVSCITKVRGNRRELIHGRLRMLTLFSAATLLCSCWLEPRPPARCLRRLHRRRRFFAIPFPS